MILCRVYSRETWITKPVQSKNGIMRACQNIGTSENQDQVIFGLFYTTVITVKAIVKVIEGLKVEYDGAKECRTVQCQTDVARRPIAYIPAVGRILVFNFSDLSGT